MFKRVLLPLDGSPESEEALDAAVSIALAADALLDLVLVRQPPAALELPFPIPVSNRAADEIYLKDIVVRAARAGLTRTRTSVLEGDPSQKICDVAKEEGCDLIVMTSRFKTGLTRVWKGSVADSVMRHSHVPVLLIRSLHRPALTMPEPVRYGRILLLLDGSASAASMIPTVRELAACHRASIVLLRVVERPALAGLAAATAGSIAAGGFAIPEVDPTLSEEAARREVSEASEELDKTASELRHTGCAHVSWYVELGSTIPETVLSFAGAHQIDLIAMTTNGRNASRVVVGSVADGILRDSSLPVLLRCANRNLTQLPHVPNECLECQLPGLPA